MKVERKLLATAVVLLMFVSMFAVFSLPAETAYVDVDDYAYLEGVLDTDSYVLYPYENKSLDIGFSMYGEMVNPDEPVGLRYDDGVDPFSNENVSAFEWNEGWLMNITYDYEGDLHNVWAYALFSDFRATEGDWITNATGPLDDRPGYRGGRKTNGYAETEDMEVIYDGPRRCIVLLETTIYDPEIPNPKDPDDPKGLPLVVLYIHVVFNKVKKYVLMIKDIKLTTESKLLEKVQVKFGQRGEWDLGWEPEDWMPRSYAHFYHALPTKYYKHPWYYTDDYYTGYDMVQMIDQSENFVAYAAYWPELMSYRVESISELTRRDKLTDVSDWEHHWLGEEGMGDGNYNFETSIPGYYQDWLWYPDCAFPPYWGEVDPWDGWDGARPDVYVDGVKKTEGVDYDWGWEPGLPGGYDRPWRGFDPGEEAEEISGIFGLFFHSSQPDTADIYVHWKLHAEQDDMTVEPRTPYTFGEWVFDLSYDDEDLPTHQFRCVTVYGVTDLNDGDDWDIDGDENVIDSEVLFQLDEVFNPWDLRQAVGQWSWGEAYGMYDWDWGDGFVRDYWPGKWTERWVEFYTGDGVEDEFWLPQQIVVPGPHDDPIDQIPAWDAYCSPREKVLVDGVLQVPGEDNDYEIYWHWNPEETWEGPLDIKAGTSFELFYPRIVPGSESVRIEWEDGTTTTLWQGTDYDYSVDCSNGKLYIWPDIELEEDDELVIDYYTYFPGCYIEFYEDSVPEEDAEIKILYSTFRIVYKTDKFIPYIDGFRMENTDAHMYVAPEDFGMFALRYGPVIPEYFISWTVGNVFPNWITVLLNGADLDPMYWDFWEESGEGYIFVNYTTLELDPSDVIEVIYPIFSGRYEWTTIGTETGPADAIGASMVTEGFRQWKNFDTKISGLDYKRKRTPDIPYIFRNVSGTGDVRDDYYDDQGAQTVESKGRAHLRDDWCTTLPVASSNIIVIGGLYPNLAAEYFNDFTDVYYNRIGSDFGDGFYSHACWGRNFYVNTEDKGYAHISTYKDLNGTVGFIVWGITGDDTYYATYALQHGLLKIMEWLQPGVTSLVLEFDYTKHPTDICFFHVVECLGTITECGGFEYGMWEMFEYDDELTMKYIMNSYSSEYWVFHIHIDFDVAYAWTLPDMFAIEVTYPQYICFHWEAKIHPDP